jgi:Axonemal dynein light chain
MPESNKDLLRKKKGNELDEEDPISLKSYLDTILPPKESTENGQIFMQFVSCTPATTNEVIQLAVI